MNNITLKEIAERLERCRKLVIVTHDRPDGDCIGSAYAVKNALTECETYVVNDCTLSGRLQFVAGGESDLSPDRIGDDFRPDLVLAVDTATFAMTGKCGQKYKDAIEIRIDHHEMGEDYAAHNYVVPASASCGEIIFDLLSLMGKINRETAAPLYAAICADTGCFRYSAVTADTMRKVAVLMETGIDFSDIAARMTAVKTPAEIRTLRAGYEGMELYCGGKVSCIVISQETKDRLQLCYNDLGVLPSIARDVEGVVLGIVIKQCDGSDTKFSISMRSDPSIAANELCALFGGGGHRCAAGGTVYADSASAAKEAVMQAVLQALEGKL